jgi:signal transduction histidine kinase
MLSDRALSENLYRLSQEALNNAVKHSFAKNITVSISQAGSQVLLTVKDNGVGLPELTSPVSGLGLRTMRYRANVIGGIFDVRRQDDGGTIVSCSVYIP